MDELETRPLHRTLAALPDMATAAYLLIAWWFPIRIGRDGVFASIALIAMELPALMALACLFMLHSATRLPERAKALVLLIAAIAGVGHFAMLANAALPSLGLMAAILSMLWGKWLIFAATRRHSTWTFEGMKLFGHVLAFLLIFNLAKDMEIARGGFSEAALADLQLPSVLEGGRMARDATPWQRPWWLLAGGIAYFTFSAASRYFLSVREPVRP